MLSHLDQTENKSVIGYKLEVQFQGKNSYEKNVNFLFDCFANNNLLPKQEIIL